MRVWGGFSEPQGVKSWRSQEEVVPTTKWRKVSLELEGETPLSSEATEREGRVNADGDK